MITDPFLVTPQSTHALKTNVNLEHMASFAYNTFLFMNKLSLFCDCKYKRVTTMFLLHPTGNNQSLIKITGSLRDIVETDRETGGFRELSRPSKKQEFVQKKSEYAVKDLSLHCSVIFFNSFVGKVM